MGALEVQGVARAECVHIVGHPHFELAALDQQHDITREVLDALAAETEARRMRDPPDSPSESSSNSVGRRPSPSASFNKTAIVGTVWPFSILWIVEGDTPERLARIWRLIPAAVRQVLMR